MKRSLRAPLLAICSLALLSGYTTAQAACPEGQTAAGECVSTALAQTMRETSIIFSQPKLSYTAYPVLPSGDWRVRYPNQLNPDPLRPGGTFGVGGPASVIVAPPAPPPD